MPDVLKALRGLAACLVTAVHVAGQIGLPNPAVAVAAPPKMPPPARTIRITDAPFSASAAGETVTATAGPVKAGSSALPVRSCETFLPGEGVLVRGADTTGPKFITTVQSCDGTLLHLSAVLPFPVAAGARVQHDETVVFQSAIQALAKTGGRILVPRGIFRLNGALQDPAGANAILKMPDLNYGSQQPVVISITGSDKPAGAGGYDSNAPTLQTDMAGGALIGGYNAGGRPYPPFTNVWLDLENLQFVGYHNPDFIAVDAHAMVAFQGHHLSCNTGLEQVTDPTHPASWCIKMPALLNNYVNEVDDVLSLGFYNGFTFAEHTVAGAVHAVNCHNGFIFDNGSNPSAPVSYVGNSIYAAHLDTLLCHVSIVGGASETPVFIASADLEINSELDISDPGNKLLGVLYYNDPYNSPIGRPQVPPRVKGAANLAIYNLRSAKAQMANASRTEESSGGEEVVSSSTKLLDPGIRDSTVGLTGPYRFTLAQGRPGALKCLTFVQPATGGPHTVVPPPNLLGFTKVGDQPGKHSTQCFTFSGSQKAWLPTSPGMQNY